MATTSRDRQLTIADEALKYQLVSMAGQKFANKKDKKGRRRATQNVADSSTTPAVVKMRTDSGVGESADRPTTGGGDFVQRRRTVASSLLHLE